MDKARCPGQQPICENFQGCYTGELVVHGLNQDATTITPCPSLSFLFKLLSSMSVLSLLGTNSPPSAGLSLSFLWLNFTTFPSTPLTSSPSYGRLFNHSLVQQPSQVYLQSLLRVHSVLSYSSILRVLRIPKPSTEPWRALPGTGFCH